MRDRERIEIARLAQEVVRIHAIIKLRWRAHEREHDLLETAKDNALRSLNERLEGMVARRVVSHEDLALALRPLQQAHERGIGIWIAVTAGAGAIGALVTFLLSLWLKTR